MSLNPDAIWRLTLNMGVWKSPESGVFPGSYQFADSERLRAIVGDGNWFFNAYRWNRNSCAPAVSPGSTLPRWNQYVLVRGDTASVRLRMEAGVSNPKRMTPAELRVWRNMSDWPDEQFPWEVA